MRDDMRENGPSRHDQLIRFAVLLALLGSGFYFVQWAYSRDILDLVESIALLVAGMAGVRPSRGR